MLAQTQTKNSTSQITTVPYSINSSSKSTCNIINLNLAPKSKKRNIHKNKNKAPSHGMNAFTLEEVKLIKEYLLTKPERYKSNKTNIRDYTMFVFACNSGRRAGDILNLKFYNILHDDCKTIKEHIELYEEKTGKESFIYITDSLKEALTIYLDSLDYEIGLDDYVFTVRNKDKITGKYNPMSYEQYRKMYQKIKEDLSEIESLRFKKIGTHSPRKTGSTVLWEATKGNTETVRRFLGHTKLETTNLYLEGTLKLLDEEVKKMNL